MTSSTIPDTRPEADAALLDRVSAQVVGRAKELELLVATLAAGRDIVLEGPPGTSKSTLLRTIASEWQIPMVLVEGNADLSPTLMLGHHSPSEVLASGYSAASFVPGPLIEAMTRGGLLYVEEFNRAPEDTINTLLAAMSERRVVVPRVGEFVARGSFRVIASMNPYDSLGTKRLSTSILDRMCRLSVTYQTIEEEREVVAQHVGADFGLGLVDAVAIARKTRAHTNIRQGSSVRGAIDVALVMQRLAAMREVDVPADLAGGRDADYVRVVRDSVVVGLSARVHLERGADITVEEVLDEILEEYFVADVSSAPG